MIPRGFGGGGRFPVSGEGFSLTSLIGGSGIRLEILEVVRVFWKA